MDEDPPVELPRRRFRFDSLTFILGFGLGTFIGVALAIAAFALASDPTASPSQTQAINVPATNTPDPFLTSTPDRRARTRAQLDVRLGPGDSFAIVGIINRGEAVAIVGRDLNGEWVAIQFPPGSAGRGWLPVKDLDGASDLSAVAVTAATPLARTLPTVAPSSITSSAGASADNGFDPEPTSSPRPVSTALRAEATTTATPAPASTSIAAAGGGTDMAISSVSRLADGRVRVVVSNRGPGDVLGATVFVVVRDLAVRSEQLIGPASTVAAGSSITVTTSGLLVTEDADIQASVDPMGSLRDPDRSNNSTTVLLRAPPTPEPTLAPGRD